MPGQAILCCVILHNGDALIFCEHAARPKWDMAIYPLSLAVFICKQKCCHLDARAAKQAARLLVRDCQLGSWTYSWVGDRIAGHYATWANWQPTRNGANREH